MLIFAILMSFFGFIFAAPGAVVIKTYYLTKERNGKISAAGPIVNIALAIIFLILILLFPIGLINEISKIGLLINAWIGLFNMIPFGNIDGQKILAWSKPVYISLIIAALILLIIHGLV